MGLLALVLAGSSLAARPSPPTFEENRGQAREDVAFLARLRGAVLLVKREELVLALPGGAGALRLRLVGAGGGGPVAVETASERSHYFRGSDPTAWRLDVPHARRVEYPDVYPGITLALHGEPEGVEYDFVLAPGADPARIRLKVDGADDLMVAPSGGLSFGLGSRRVLQRPARAFQDREGVRRVVAVRTVSRGAREIGFELGPHDPALPVVIDPVLAVETLFGGSGDDVANAVALDAAGNAYVTGETASTDLLGAVGAARGGTDAFVAKLSPAGVLLWAAYLGGSGPDVGNGLAVDAAGNATVTGETGSTDFPATRGAFRTRAAGGSDAFVARLDPSGSSLAYATYLGGSGNDRGAAVAVDAAGEAVVAGRLDSTDLPVTPGAFQTYYRGGDFDAFVAKLSAAGDRLVYATYLGGSSNDAAFGLALDGAGDAIVVGGSRSPDFPTTSTAYQASNLSTDAFVTRLNATGTSLLYSTLLGGSLVDRANAVAVDGRGLVYVTGQTTSTDFPLVSALQPLYGGGPNDAFVARLDPSASGAASLTLSTYLGASGDDRGQAIAARGDGTLAVVGSTSSSGLAGPGGASTAFPTKLALQPLYGGGANDAFVALLDAGGASLASSTFVGDTGDDRAMGVALSASGVAVTVGRAEAGRGADAFLARVTAQAPLVATPIPALSVPALVVLALAVAGIGAFLSSRAG